MLTKDGPKVLEYNTRFGDPETQAILPRLNTDILELLWAASCGTLAGVELSVGTRQALCVVIAASGYPGAYPKGDRIRLPSGSELPPETWILQAGTVRNSEGELVTQGGRVLNVVSLAPTLMAAADRAYRACEQVQCASKYYRRDIGARQIARA
jgi:phosphoribosylamine--glycine ligase